jgi:myo-inositol-1-phosphate synthase
MNLLGGGDGAALAEPARARSKLDSKGRLLEEILGYAVEAPIHIEERASWESARPRGTSSPSQASLGVRMSLWFTSEGCDSTLAAQPVLDLVRLMAPALARPGA